MGARWGKPLQQRPQGMTPHPRAEAQLAGGDGGGGGGAQTNGGPAAAALSPGAAPPGRALPAARAPLPARSLTPGRRSVGARRAPGGARLPLAPGPPAAPRHGSAPAAERREASPEPAAPRRLPPPSPPRSGPAPPPSRGKRCAALRSRGKASPAGSSGQGCSSPFCAALAACLLPRRACPPPRAAAAAGRPPPGARPGRPPPPAQRSAAGGGPGRCAGPEVGYRAGCVSECRARRCPPRMLRSRGRAAVPPAAPRRSRPLSISPCARGASGSTRCLAGGRRGELGMRELPCPATSGSFAAVPEIEPTSADSRSCTLTAKATFSQFSFSLPSSTLGPSLRRKTKPNQTITLSHPLPSLNGTTTNMPKHNHGTSPLAAKSK